MGGIWCQTGLVVIPSAQSVGPNRDEFFDFYVVLFGTHSNFDGNRSRFCPVLVGKKIATGSSTS